MNNIPLSRAGAPLFHNVLVIALYLLAGHALAQTAPADQTAPDQSRGREQFTRIYDAGDYRAASRLGSELLRTQPNDNEVRFRVANSFAWTGRYDEAIAHYQALSGTKQASKANLGLANVYRWNGLPGLAQSLYQRVLTVEPDNKDAREGLTYALRETRSQTSASVLRWKDSLDTVREGILLSQRWTDKSQRHRFEVEADFLRDRRNELRVNQRDVTFRYAGIADPLKPRFEISAQESPEKKFFAGAEIRVPNTPLSVGAGHVNWGKLAFDPNALAAALTANQVELQADGISNIGAWYGGYNAYRISDSNLIHDLVIRFTPSWQPIRVQEIKVFAGFEGRKARFNSPAYWSPADGNYLLTAGISGEWVDPRLERSVSLQYGVPVGGEARSSYSVAGSIRHWINDRLSIGGRLSHQRSQRTGAYRASTAMITIQGLW
jgi:tetratricopeptide (TPR) repeat protein